MSAKEEASLRTARKHRHPVDIRVSKELLQQKTILAAGESRGHTLPFAVRKSREELGESAAAVLQQAGGERPCAAGEEHGFEDSGHRSRVFRVARPAGQYCDDAPLGVYDRSRCTGVQVSVWGEKKWRITHIPSHFTKRKPSAMSSVSVRRFLLPYLLRVSSTFAA